MDFENRLHLASQSLVPQYRNSGYPKMVTYYFRDAPFVADAEGRPETPLKPNLELIKVAIELGAVCDFIVMPTNVPHFFKNDIEIASNKKILSIVDVTLEEVKKRAPKKVGLMTLGLTLKNKLYNAKLDELKIPWISLEEDQLPKLDEYIWAIMEGKISQEGYEYACNMADFLRNKGADIIIMGCTEIPLLLMDKSKSPDLINPAALLAEAAIKYSIA